jgi:hypothetical protein
LPTAICLCAHFAQPLNLVERDAASLACRQAIQFKRSNSHADNPQDFMAQLGQHTPDFAIFPFRQDDFKPHAFALRLEAANERHCLSDAGRHVRRYSYASSGELFVEDEN